MKILFLGYSSIVQRRILPIVPTIEEITAVAVASNSQFNKVVFPEGIAGTAYDNYETALDESGADMVYVSTVNSEHGRWAEAALQRGLHTIVDKPAFLSLAEAHRMFDLAQAKHCCLGESIVYAYHPQIKAIQQLFADNDDRPTRITATFSFPPLPPDNFRHRSELGGGALWDLGQYAMTPGRLFFGTEPKEIAGWVNDSTDEVETSFSVLAQYDNGRSLVGHFGFNTAYRNHIELLGAKTAVWTDRIFTIPDTLENVLNVHQNNEQFTVTIPAASPFACFFQTVTTAIHNQAYESFATNLLTDAQTIQRLRDEVTR